MKSTQSKPKDVSQLEWPNSCRTVVRLAPLLLAGISTRPTQHHLLRHMSQSGQSNAKDCDGTLKSPDLKLKSLIKLRTKTGGHTQSTSVSTPILVHSKKLKDELGKYTPQQTLKVVKKPDQIIRHQINQPAHESQKPNPEANDDSDTLPADNSNGLTNSHQTRIRDSMYHYDIKKPLIPLPSKVENRGASEPFVDDRLFKRSYYNRKDENNIYSRPPYLRRVRHQILPSDPEYGIEQDWIASWDPTEHYIQKEIRETELIDGKPKIKSFNDPNPRLAPLDPLMGKPPPKVAESVSRYTLPERQEYKRLDEALVARLVEIQTGQVAHRHRRMRPTLGVSKLHRGTGKTTRIPHIGPSAMHHHHPDLNEEPDDLELSLAICDLSLEEKHFENQIATIKYKEKLSEIRAKNKRKKQSSHVFRQLQSNVEHIVDDQTRQGLILAKRAHMDNFLHACGKHRIFLETIGNDYNPWAGQSMDQNPQTLDKSPLIA